MRDQITQILAANIRRAMQEREINASELARTAGLNRTAIYDILAERSQSPRVKTVSLIANALKIPISDLFLTEGQLKAQLEILQTFRELPASDQERVQVIAAAFLPQIEG